MRSTRFVASGALVRLFGEGEVKRRATDEYFLAGNRYLCAVVSVAKVARRRS